MNLCLIFDIIMVSCRTDHHKMYLLMIFMAKFDINRVITLGRMLSYQQFRFPSTYFFKQGFIVLGIIDKWQKHL